MKWQFFEKEKGKAGRAAGESADPGGGGTWQGMRVGVGVGLSTKDRATYDSEHRAGPVGG